MSDVRSPFTPLVSIGMPVYNGSRFLSAALTALVNQTFADFEVIICDDASTDDTAAICSAFMAKDRRFLYHRNPETLGAGPNFNKAFELSHGQYFKWVAHDDLIEPTYLERCVGLLLDHPDIVLCHSQTLVDDGTRRVPLRELTGLDSPSVKQRFASITLAPHWALDLYGVFRADALRKTGLHRSYYGADKALLAEIVLLGRCARIPEPLFISRDHPQRSLRARDLIERRSFIDPKTRTQFVIPSLNLFRDYCRAVAEHVDNRGDRARCYGVLVRWWSVNWHWARVLVDLACALVPSLARVVHRLRARYHRRPIGTAG